jgi:serine/threonine-protein kinase
MSLGTNAHRVIGRYVVYDAIAAGGMATVHLGRFAAAAGFARTVAIKRLHENLAADPEFSTMFLDEARLAARVNHPNVIQTLDVVALGSELFLVMEYVHGDSLSTLMQQVRKTKCRVPPPVATHIACEVLQGLHAAHEARNERGEPLDIVHRDVSPHNILVGVDGVSRVFDFGVAKSLGRVQTTREGQVKGKLAYMAPENFRAEHVTRRSDIYAAGIVLWETLTGRRLFTGACEAEVVYAALAAPIEPPSAFAPDLPEALDRVVLRALERDPARRYETAAEMALALEAVCPPVPKHVVADWVRAAASPKLALRAKRVEEIERLVEVPAVDTPAPESSADTIEIETLDDDEVEAEPPLRSALPWRRLAIAAVALAAVAGGVLALGSGSAPASAVTRASSAPAPVATIAPTPPGAPGRTPASPEAPVESEGAAAIETATSTAAPAPAHAAARPALATSARAAPTSTGERRPRADELLGRD